MAWKVVVLIASVVSGQTSRDAYVEIVETLNDTPEAASELIQRAIASGATVTSVLIMPYYGDPS